MPVMLPNMDGEEIRRRREAMGLTQEELAEALHVGRRTIGAWERGENVPRNRMGMLRDFFGMNKAEASADSIGSASDLELLGELMRRALDRQSDNHRRHG